MNRAKVVIGHLSREGRENVSRVETRPTGAASHVGSADDVVVCAARRTAMCKGRRGGFKVRPAATRS